VFCDLAVMLADGGRCVADLVALGSQPTLFAEVASVSTARRVLLSVGQVELDRLRRARAQARARASAAGAAPAEVILDFDATPITAHSDKQGAAGHYKGGFGHNLPLVSCGREVLAVVLRPGNAGANNAADHLDLFELALAQLPPRGAGWADPRALGLGRRQPRAGRRVPRNRRPVLLRLRDRQARARCDPGAAQSRVAAGDRRRQPAPRRYVCGAS
jgi:Transposase DDE domain group 1